ncbi:MAG TPA: 50S ribosomal protein L18 [Patescibacteria group bacterium]|nr:50S ribosomal protein L18 [Patescibacteria group bacterium]
MKESITEKNKLRYRRTVRTRSKIFGTATKPRLAVFRSLKHFSVQAINDQANTTVAVAKDAEVKGKNKMELARVLGKLMAQKLTDKKISQTVFDKRYYKYHGLVKEIAEGVREGGIKM